MKVNNARVQNFRLLQDVDVALDSETTMVVGRNNSGKTSLVEVFRKFFGPDGAQRISPVLLIEVPQVAALG